MKYKKLLWSGIFLILLVAVVFLALFIAGLPFKQSQQSQNIQKTQSAAFESTTQLGYFINRTPPYPIYVSDLNPLAEEQYNTSEAKNLNPVSIDQLLNIYIERKILDKQNVGDVSAQITQIEKTTGVNLDQAKYQALRDAFINAHFKSWSIYSIDFWIPPTNADGSLTKNASQVQANPKQTNKDRQKLLADVNNALNFAKNEMQKGTSIFSIATQITKDFPVLADILAVNGIIFKNSTNASLWDNPTAVYFDKNYIESPHYKAIYSMTEKNAVTEALNDDNMGGSTIKLVSVDNPSGVLDNYANWLKNQKSIFSFTNDTIKQLENTK